MAGDSKKCEVCGKNCVPITSEHNPKASEWYCDWPCHKSHPMDVETAMYFISMRRQQSQGLH